MEQQLVALRAGQIDFDEFAKQTWRQWEALATKLFFRYDLPSGVERADLVQEMLLAAWTAVRLWDPNRGTLLRKYVTWTAYNEAKRWVHTQRAAYRRSDHAQSRHPIALADLATDDMDETTLLDLLDCTAATGETTVLAIETFGQIAAAVDTETAAVLELWATTGSSEAAATALLSDPKIVSAMRLWQPGAAQTVVHKALETSLAVALV